jgi:hypothetical protein
MANRIKKTLFLNLINNLKKIISNFVQPLNKGLQISLFITFAFPTITPAETETQNSKNRYLDESITFEEFSPSIQSTPLAEPPIAPLSQGLCIIVRLDEQDAWMFEDGILINSTRVNTGKRGKETPTGFFYIINKHEKWISTIYHRSMPFFLRLNPGDFGLHEGILSNKPSSNGCIRLPLGKAEAFFKKAPIGTPVFIVP